MAIVLPHWQAHDSPDYDVVMKDKCDKLMNELLTSASRRSSVLTRPRELHHELFSSFVPAGRDEYAGTYRGTPGTSLAARELSAASVLDSQGHYAFSTAGEVPVLMARLLKETQELMDDGRRGGGDDYGKLVALAYTFCWFGKIHPFLDGNGHVQRAMFVAMATEFGYPLSTRFAIHPRPYDCLLALALETFTRAPAGKENDELAFTTEYLGFFLDGPFDVPRGHIGKASLYA